MPWASINKIKYLHDFTPLGEPCTSCRAVATRAPALLCPRRPEYSEQARIHMKFCSRRTSAPPLCPEGGPSKMIAVKTSTSQEQRLFPIYLCGTSCQQLQCASKGPPWAGQQPVEGNSLRRMHLWVLAFPRSSSIDTIFEARSKSAAMTVPDVRSGTCVVLERSGGGGRGGSAPTPCKDLRGSLRRGWIFEWVVPVLGPVDCPERVCFGARHSGSAIAC
jgi:hypothetical protein